MRHIFLFLLLSLSSVALGSQVLVVIGEVAITSTDVDKRLEALRLANPEMKNDFDTRNYILDNLVNEELFRNESLRLKLSVTPEEVAEHFKDLEQINKFTKAQIKIFENNSSLCRQVESQVLWRKLINAVFYNKIKVSAAEIRDEQKIKAEKIKDVTFKQIIFNNSETHKIKNLKATNCTQLNKAALAAGLAKPDNNTLKFYELNEELQSLMSILPVNQLSKIIDLQDYKQVIMICNKNVTSISRNAKDIEMQLSDKKMNAEAQKYLTELKKRICIERH